MPFRVARDYYDFVISQIARLGLQSELHKIQLFDLSRNKATIGGNDITFPDGAKLRIFEEFELDGGEVRRIKYAFHYSYSGNRFFRYDKDSAKATYPDHAECHLHVNDERGVRYITHETNVTEILEFIAASFYSPHR